MAVRTKAQIKADIQTHIKAAIGNDKIEASELKGILDDITDSYGELDAPTGDAGGDLTGSYPNPDIADDAVTFQKIADSAVNTQKIADEAVNADKIATNGIIETNMGDDSVSSRTIIDNAVITEKIANGAITFSKIADGAVGYHKLADNVVEENHIFPQSVTTDKIAANAVTLEKLSVTGATSTGDIIVFNATTNEWEIASNGASPTGDAGGDLTGSYPNPTIGAGKVNGTHIANEAIEGVHIADQSIENQNLGYNSVETLQILNGAVTLPKMNFAAMQEFDSKEDADAALPPRTLYVASANNLQAAEGAVLMTRLV